MFHRYHRYIVTQKESFYGGTLYIFRKEAKIHKIYVYSILKESQDDTGDFD